ncbi:MAG: heavy metal translocating P-type ATPase [Candidatus Aquicultorales bacterium]
MHEHHERREEHKEHGAYDKHAGHSTAVFARKFWVCLVLTIPVVIYSELPQEYLGYRPPEFPGSEYLTLVLGSVVFFYGGWVFIRGAAREIGARLPGMMTLISLAITAAYLYSVYAVFAGFETLFWELTTLVTIMLLGHWLEMRAVAGAQSALQEISKLMPDTAELIDPSGGPGSRTRIVPVSDLKLGDRVISRPGSVLPADGRVVEGYSEVNEAAITGESRPVKKEPGSEVIAGSINGDGALTVEVTKTGDDTFLSGVARLIKEAQASKSRLQLLSDRAAYYLTIIALISGGLSFSVWLGLGAGFPFAIGRAVTVLVIACPHALGLAIPLVAAISTTMAAQNGFLVKQRLALESARDVSVVLFDKTGTLTKGEYGVTSVVTGAHGASGDEVLRLAAGVDAKSEHPIAKTIVNESRSRGIDIPSAEGFQRVPGKGVSGVIEGKEVLVGGASMIADMSAEQAQLRGAVKGLEDEGKTIVYVIVDGAILGAIALADIIRPESAEAVDSLKEAGVKVAMITGDSEGVARWVAGTLGIDEFFANVLPQDKAAKVKALQEKGERVAMVGDGVNDAPALVQADIGIAIGAGTNVAVESAGIILVRNDPRDIGKIVKLSRASYSKMLQNLFWATGYNVVAIPLAAGVLASRGIILQPAVGAILMSLSTVIVAINALLLRRNF